MSREQELVKFMQEEKLRLETILARAGKRLQNAPAGSIRITRCRNHLQFFLRSDSREKSGMPFSRISFSISTQGEKTLSHQISSRRFSIS